jgi:probable rRNA maturation factor
VAIDVINKQRLVKVDRQRLIDLAGAALHLVVALQAQDWTRADGQALAASDCQLTLVFVRDKKIRALNREFRGKDYATDVLSFHTSDGADEAFDFGGEPDLGDVVISVDTALRQAEEAGHSFGREAEELILHGILHLYGYDHETDHGEMNRLELKLRKRLLDED